MTINQECKKRRIKLAAGMPDNSAIILPSANICQRNADADFPFRQNSDFYYFTGFNEPEALLLLTKQNDKPSTILFNRPNDPAVERWDGPRLGQANAARVLQIDEAYDIHTLDNEMPQLLANITQVYFPFALANEWNARIMRWLKILQRESRKGTQWPVTLHDASPLCHELRLFKSENELTCIQKAVDATVDGHLRAMQATEVGGYEYQLEAELTHEFVRQGCRSHAYTPIVGSGNNSCVLHYITNESQIKDGDLILIDAGAEYQNYAADITRTFPANGKFSAQQKAIYEIVLEAQLAVIDLVKPGTPWPLLQETAVDIITEGLVDVGILKGDIERLIEECAYAKFYMHSSGHWLGLDVHDAGSYRVNNEWRELAPNMVLTVEPGIYIPEGTEGVDESWWKIGVRIEDDVLVTQDGHEVLSDKLPKSVTDIEAVMRDKN